MVACHMPIALLPSRICAHRGRFAMRPRLVSHCTPAHSLCPLHKACLLAISSAMSRRLDITSLKIPERLKFYVDDKIYDITPANILDFLWINSANVDGPCLVCGKTFTTESGPSVRSFALDQPHLEASGSSDDVEHIRVHNRHRACMKEPDLKYAAISHVWHDAVREAHASGQHHSEGAFLVYSVPWRTLVAVTRTFTGDAIEIWHDYWSVPQWNYESQQRILLYIPAIYKMPAKMIVHLEDYEPQWVELMVGFSKDLDAHMDTMTKEKDRYDAVVAFLKTSWSHRMWVTLEFLQGRRACVMDSEYNICRMPNSSKGSFAELRNECRRNYLMLRNGLRDRDPKMYDYLGSLAYISRGQDTPMNNLRCLGSALDEVAVKDCKYYRDRFIAIHAMLWADSSDVNASEVPKSQLGACEWVWTKALESGDYTPLLLQPNGGQETEVPSPSWLVGHEMMNGFTWELGRPLELPQGRTIVRDGIVEPEMERLGVITEISSLDLNENDTIRVLCALIGLYIECGPYEIGSFVQTIQRLYPIRPFFDQLADQGQPGYRILPRTLEEYTAQNSSCQEDLSSVLAEYTQRKHEGDVEACRKLSVRIAELLGLNEKCGPMADDCRTRDVTRRAKWRRVRDGGANGAICKVVCEQCQTKCLYELDLRRTGRVGAKVYRIPGMTLSSSSQSGVGLIVFNNRIVGRLRYGTPTGCQCERRMERVQLN